MSDSFRGAVARQPGRSAIGPGNMDRARPPSRFRLTKRYGPLAGGSIGVVALVVAVTLVDTSTPRVDRADIETSFVQYGMLEVKVRGSGQLVPRTVAYLDAQVTGRVTKKLVAPGDSVKSGDLLIELSNPQVVALADEARSAVQGAAVDLQATQSSLQTDLMDHEIGLTQARFNYRSAQLQLRVDGELNSRDLIPRVQYEKSQLSVDQLHQALGFQETQVEAIRANIGAQLEVKRARLAELVEALGRARTAVTNLQIRAGIDGIVQTLVPEIGQQLMEGQSIGRIAKSAPLYAELKVAARDTADVAIGQKAVVDTHAGRIDGVVSRIDPAITDGTVLVDVTLTGPLTRGARPQLPVDGDIYLAQLPDTLHVDKLPDARADSEVSVYRFEPSGRYADRVVIRTGAVSLTEMQVKEGLRAGDRIITSQPGNWQSADRIRID